MKLTLLADEPAAAETVAKWYFDQWCLDSGRHSFEFVLENVTKATRRDEAPLLVLAKIDQKLVGAAELKLHEMEMFPEYQHWLGGVYVRADARGQGIASALVSEVIRLAREAGITYLYLQTEDLSGGLYNQFGFKSLHEVDSKGVQVSVMMVEL